MAREDDLWVSPVSPYAGKWGRYVRAPDFYFDIMREFGSSFVPLGELADTRFGVKSGCDAFFMPRDITNWALGTARSDSEFRERFGVDRAQVSRGIIKIVRAGDRSEHPIEAEYLAPEVHSLMTIERPLVCSADLDRVVLLVGSGYPPGSWVGRYIRYGESHTFPSGKSKPVPVPKRSTCAARDPWYDLTKLVKPGFALGPKATQYRHVAVFNPEGLIANCRLYDLSLRSGGVVNTEFVTAILNSTLVALWRHFYGRYTGNEGSLDTMVVDLALLEMPDPQAADADVINRALKAFQALSRRPLGCLVEEQLMTCHSPDRAEVIASGPLVLSDELRRDDRRMLDDAVFELLGVNDAERRRDLVTKLHEETARHFRKIRVVEIQKQLQRTKTGARRFTAADLADDAWHAAELSDWRPLSEWLDNEPGPKSSIAIPESGVPSLMPASDTGPLSILAAASDLSEFHVNLGHKRSW
jgi:hypothetical protein